MRKPVLVLIALLGLIIGCQVDKAGFPVNVNNSLLDGTWYLKSEIVAGYYAGTSLASDTLKTFTKGDFYTFNSDNTVNYGSSASTAVYKAYYSYVTSQTGATLNVGSNITSSSSLPYTVNKLSKDSLILFTSATATLGNTVSTTNLTFMYTH